MDMSRVKEHMEVIGADGVHVGTVDRIEDRRLKLSKTDRGEDGNNARHHYIDIGLIADVEGDRVRLSANSAVAVTFEDDDD
ncbi:DUF2171 domain-containing protein [Methylocystis parvus]|uniref:DUF2171 domain-containing protein n=1 Tax=Methylocystis parvus TaxID=134 RepID=A0A6B8MCT6_9HYPH|nr:DUF2171 domain-containing protein [Methylocystis parvus]QGN00186.1 DUF2171 domain-containing protein [Methylocystis parvus]WBK02503.1 DUF2171 domain-containing protein [Methylocystis parvus OBBP]